VIDVFVFQKSIQKKPAQMEERAPFASPFKPRTKVNGQISSKFSGLLTAF